MFGDNPKRSALKGDGNILEVQDIFPTLQGEGPYAGWPAIFIRLGGCNLACDFCDTEFESYKSMEISLIINEVLTLACKGNIKLVVLTGGEPFRQPLTKICDILLENDLMVQIETNGTLYQPIDERADVVCSPKNINGVYSPIRPDLLERISAFKFIISAQDKNYGAVSEVGQSLYNVPVYVQAMDEYDEIKNNANVALALSLAMENGYRLSLQLHKFLKIK